MNGNDGLVRVGDLARARGLTVRALYHYEDVGLLAPIERTPAGHRLYGTAAVGRLYRSQRASRTQTPRELRPHPHEALTAATHLPARTFRLDDRGAIEVGARADLVLVRGDPIQDISSTQNIARVWVVARHSRP